MSDRTVEVDYWAGRKDCDSSNRLPVRDLPSHSATNSIQILQGFFNLNEREAVALMGTLRTLIEGLYCTHLSLIIHTGCLIV